MLYLYNIVIVPYIGTVYVTVLYQELTVLMYATKRLFDREIKECPTTAPDLINILHRQAMHLHLHVQVSCAPA